MSDRFLVILALVLLSAVVLFGAPWFHVWHGLAVFGKVLFWVGFAFFISRFVGGGGCWSRCSRRRGPEEATV